MSEELELLVIMVLTECVRFLRKESVFVWQSCV